MFRTANRVSTGNRTFNHLWAQFGVMFLLLAASLSVLAADGRVFNFTGRPTLNGSPITRPTPVNSGDTLSTPAGSTVKVVMNDGTVLDLKPNTTLKISDYAYQEKQPSTWRSRLSLVQGALRYVSGKIVKKDPELASITAGATTIGIRGSYQSISFDGATVQIDSSIGTATINFADGSSLVIQTNNTGVANVQTQQTSLSTITTPDPAAQAAQAIADSGADAGTVQNALAGQSSGDQALILAVLINNATQLGVTDPNVLADAVGAAAGASNENAALFVLVASALDPANKEVYKARAKAAAPNQSGAIDEAGDIADDLEPDDDQQGDNQQGDDDTSGTDTAENPATTSPTTP